MNEKDRETLYTVIALALANGRVANPQPLAHQIADAVISTGLVASKEWTE